MLETGVMHAIEGLKESPLFKGFTDTGLQIMAGITTERTFPQGIPLFVEDMVADTLILILEGKVALTTRGKNGQPVSIGELGRREFLGELSLIQQGQRLCTATAATSVSALEIRHADFHRLLASKPQACVKLLMGIVAQFGEKVSRNKEAFKALL